ncbi:ketosynthase chain-length factor [Yinghuangia sp. ASG 101]|uniref:beta-ketoacyl synthase N-terminal-like domain-containing protein n=1 Tax=Yinghuangia sp. ASG 101 TaxID=2896848 RepID=UPI001E335541|nr:beta-ketoacyl synthase N-terminal-like domain-containing protein [Yinghuangia sp. ASG 101]UGQ10794.1 ketosynthase chain-length factor [Yinghuangia sp. ASG 101]
MSTSPRRAAVTGIGVVAPNGIGTDVFWKATREGTPHLSRIHRDGCADMPLAVAGLVEDFDATGRIEDKFLVQTDKFTHFALHAADQALHEAGVADLPEFSVGVATASSSGGGEFGQRELQNLWGTGPAFVGPYQSIAWFYAASTGQISIRGGFKGPCAVLADDEAGGLDAIAHAARSIRRGTDAMVVGAAEAPIAPYSMVCQLGYRELSLATDPARAYLPFDSAACGFAPAEGGAVLVLEDLDHARGRGVPVRATVAGYGATFTGTTGWGESRHGLAHAITAALAEAGAGPEDIDVVFADALAVPAADQAEVLALADALGPHGAAVPVTAPKAGSGRAYCGGPVLDCAAAVLALEHGVIPPTPGVFATEYDIDLVTGRARPARLRTALVLSRGLMGGNAALVLRAGDDSP